MITLQRATELLNEFPTVLYERTDGDYVLFDYRYKDYKFFQEYPEARELRGVVFHRDGTLVSRPFHVFYNVGETEDEIEFVGLYGEKQDGSMVQITYHEGDFIVASRSSLTGYVNVTATPLLTDELKEYIKQHPDWTFLFELLDPGHTIVLKHEELELVFLAARNKKTGAYGFFQGVPTRRNEYRHLDPETWEKVKNECDTDEGKSEGVVLYTVDDSGGIGNIYKYKAPWYVTVHRLATSLQPKDYIMAWAKDELDDVMSRLYKTEDVQACLDKTYEFVDYLTDTVKGMSKIAATFDTPKEVAMSLDRSTPLNGIVFSEVMRAFRGGYIEDVGRIFTEVKNNLTENKVKNYLGGE